MHRIIGIFVIIFCKESSAYDLVTEESQLSTELEIPVPVEGVAGGRLDLPCDITSPMKEDAVYLVLWYKNESPTPIYSLDARKGPVHQARQASSESLEGRSFFSVEAQPAVLQIDKVSTEDEGLYRCRVDFRKARTQHSALTVSVAIPSGAPIIKDSNGKMLGGLIGPYNEGDSLILICQTEGGTPKPSVVWWRGRAKLDDTFENLDNGVTRNELHIDSLKRRDLLATFTCQASNNKVSPPLEASVKLDIHFRPLSVHLKGKRRRLSAQKTANFECEAKGSRPESVITWRKGSYKLKNAVSRVSAQGNVTTSTLTFAPSSDDNGKFLYCMADNPAIPGSAIEDGWKLDVHYVPQLNLRLGSQLRQSTIQEEMDVYFECNIRANPWVAETGWKFEGRRLHGNSSVGMVVSNQSLVLQKVSRTQRGRYSCTATNIEGQGESNHVYLKVQYVPVCKEDQKFVFSTFLNHPVHIPCEVAADPDDVTFRWEFNGTGEELRAVELDGTRSKLTYIPRSVLDFGTIYCWARNGIGTQKIPCAFYVSPADPPAELHNCSINDLTQNGFRILCNFTLSDNLPEGIEAAFLFQVRDSGTGEMIQNHSQSFPDLLLKDLRPASWYSVNVMVENDAGEKQPFVLDVRTSDRSQITDTNSFSWNMEENVLVFIISAGIAGFMVVICLICIALKFCIRKKRRKDSLSNQGNEKSVHNSEKSADSFSEGYTCSAREDEKIRENIPDVVVFSEKAKTEEAERLKFSPKSAYWSNPITLPSDQEMAPQTKMKSVDSTPPWSTADWVIPSQPVELVTLQFQRPAPEDSRKGQGVSQPAGTIPDGRTSTSSTFCPPQTISCAKQTDV